MTTVSPQGPTPKPFDFRQEVRELVRDTAPRLFAVVDEYRPDSDDADAVVVAWGMAFENGRAEIAPSSGGRRWSLVSPDHAVRFFGRSRDRIPRLVWVNQPCDESPTPPGPRWTAPRA